MDVECMGSCSNRADAQANFFITVTSKPMVGVSQPTSIVVSVVVIPKSYYHRLV